jgi:hypothetical protein
MKTAEQIISELDYYADQESSESNIFGAFKNGLGQFWPVEYSKNYKGEWCRSVIRDRDPLKTTMGVQKYIRSYKARYRKGEANSTN